MTKGAEQMQLSGHTTLQTGEMEASRESVKAEDGNTERMLLHPYIRVANLKLEGMVGVHVQDVSFLCIEIGRMLVKH